MNSSSGAMTGGAAAKPTSFAAPAAPKPPVTPAAPPPKASPVPGASQPYVNNHTPFGSSVSPLTTHGGAAAQLAANSGSSVPKPPAMAKAPEVPGVAKTPPKSYAPTIMGSVGVGENTVVQNTQPAAGAVSRGSPLKSVSLQAAKHL